MTDGSVFISEKGDISKRFNVKDGIAIKNLLKAGIHVAFISSARTQTLLNARAKMLGVKWVYSGELEKLDVMTKWCKKLKIGLHEVAHMADDTNDLKLLGAVGVSVCPADAVDQVRTTVKIVLNTKGGDGCVREFADRYLL